MTREDLEKVFEDKSDDEILEFTRVANKLHPRRDICAFLLLDKLVPQVEIDIVSGADHDEIYLETDVDDLAKVATEEDITTLLRCGVRLDDDGLMMFA